MKKLTFVLSLFSLLALVGMKVHAQAVTDEQLGIQYYNNREFDKAAALFERLFDAKPTLFNYTYLFQSLIETGELDQATKLAHRQARKLPDEQRYTVDEGYVMIRNNQSDKAEKIFNKAIKDVPAEQRKIMELANAFMSRRENDFAIKTYLKGRQLLSPDYTFGFELAMLFEVQGNFDKMADEYLSLLETSPQMQTQVQSRLQNSLNNDPENLKSEALRMALLKKVQKKPDDIMVNELLLWLSIQLKDFNSALVQAKALDRRLTENGFRVFSLAGLCSSNGDFATAIEAYNYVIDRSEDMSLVVQSRVELLKAEYEQLIRTYPVSQPELARLETKYKKTLEEAGRNPLIFPLMRNLAHLQAFYLKQPDESIALLEELISFTANDPIMQAESKLELADIMLFTGEPWEATLLYSQVDKAFKNEPIGHEARYRNARLSFYIGEFDWARAQLDVLKAATSKLIANDAMALSLLISDNIEADSSTAALKVFARADLLLFRNQPAEALAVLDSVGLLFPGHAITDDVLMKKAEIKIKQGDFATAEKLYQEVIEKYSDGILGDDALFALAKLYEEQLHDSSKAMASYQELLMEYPGSLYTVEARKRFRTLRGDQVN